MTTVYNPQADPTALRARLQRDQGQRVVSYCAAWCRTCAAWQPAFEALAQSLPDWTFIWVDIEDSPEWLGEEDVEDFPTVLVQVAGDTRFWGVQLPYAEQLQRLLEHAATLPATPAGPGAIDALAQDAG